MRTSNSWSNLFSCTAASVKFWPLSWLYRPGSKPEVITAIGSQTWPLWKLCSGKYHPCPSKQRTTWRQSHRTVSLHSTSFQPCANVSRQVGKRNLGSVSMTNTPLWRWWNPTCPVTQHRKYCRNHWWGQTPILPPTADSHGTHDATYRLNQEICCRSTWYRWCDIRHSSGWWRGRESFPRPTYREMSWSGMNTSASCKHINGDRRSNI